MANAVAGIGLASLADGRPRRGDASGSLEAREHAVGRRVRTASGRLALSWIWSGTVSLLLGDPDRAVEEIERGLASARAAETGCRRTSRSTTCRRSSWPAVATLRPGSHLDEGTRLSRETSDHANLAYLLEAAAVVEAQAGPARAGARPARRRGQSIREGLGSFGYGYYRPDPQAIAGAAEDAPRPSRRRPVRRRAGHRPRARPGASRGAVRSASRRRPDRLAHHSYTC